MLPFTVDQFLAVFAGYNLAIWPVQVLAWALGLAAVAGIALRRRLGAALADRLALSVLAALWLWNGIAYHMLQFAAVNTAAWGFGAGFVLQGLLFAGYGWRRRFDLAFGAAPVPLLGLSCLAYALLLYQLLGPLFGHVWPAMPVFGVAPCPTAIFTFGLLLLARRRVPLPLLAVPFLWTLIGGSAAALLDVPKDLGLLAAGLPGTVLLAIGPRRWPRGWGAAQPPPKPR